MIAHEYYQWRIDNYGHRVAPGTISAITEGTTREQLARARDNCKCKKCRDRRPVCDLCKDTGDIQLTGMSSGYQGEPFIVCPACKGKTPRRPAPDTTEYEPRDLTEIPV